MGLPLRCALAGMTPVFSLDRLARRIGINQLWLKDESRNPTASFKDRASAVVVARARQEDAKVVVTASTGNAGAALAGMAAAVGQEAVIFAPRTAPAAKVAQLLVFGAKVILVDGNYDQAFDLSTQAAEEFGWYCRNTGYNPFTAEGKKTAAYEIWEWMSTSPQSSSNPEPLNIFVSVGDGNIISGIHKGFKDLLALGWLEQMPRLFGVQAQGSAAIANAFFAGDERIIPVSAQYTGRQHFRRPAARRGAGCAGCQANGWPVHPGQRPGNPGCHSGPRSIRRLCRAGRRNRIRRVGQGPPARTDPAA